MCGRFVSTNSPDEIATYFGASFEAEPLPANYNTAPTSDVYAVVAGHQPASSGTSSSSTLALAVRPFHWGLVPIWAKDIKIASSMINARAETITDKPAFKAVFRKTRCIIPMDGFYEWKTTPGEINLSPKGKPIKQPMYVHRVDNEPLAVAGLWTAWRDKNGPSDAPWLHTCTVITTAANDTMAPVHHRMPVILPATRWDQWLDPANTDIDGLRSLLVPAPNSLLTMHPVSTDVNNVRNQGAYLLDLVDPAAQAAAGQALHRAVSVDEAIATAPSLFD